MGESKTRNFSGRGCMFWLGRAMLVLVFGLVGLILAGLIYQGAGSAADGRRYPPPDQMVDVGSYRLHMYCLGEGQPAVILDHLGDGNSVEWALVQPEIAKTTRVCAYDRAGFGWSDAGPGPRTAGQAVNELQIALQKSGITGPYVLVGHSYGAGTALIFAHRYPDQTSGVVMVDPGLYESPHLPPEIDLDQDTAFVSAAPTLSRLGLLRLADSLGMGISTGDFSREQASVYRALRQRTIFWYTLNEVQQAMPATAGELRAVESLGAIPLIVLNAGQPDNDFRRAWTQFNQQAAELSTRSEFRMVAGADHASLVTERRFAAEVVQAVLDVMGER